MKRMMVYAALATLVFTADLYTPAIAEANILCKWFGYCLYESPGFSITVVDKETGQPLADVHALVEWAQYGYHGRGGPLMVQDAVSTPDGVLAFPPWGPIRGSSAGLVLNQDPVITLFKPGYHSMLIDNAPGTDEKARVRGFTLGGQTFKMAPFRGTANEWVEQLKKIWRGIAFPRSAQTSRRFPGYLNRVRRVWAERVKVPEQYRVRPEFFWSVEDELKSLEEGQQ